MIPRLRSPIHRPTLRPAPDWGNPSGGGRTGKDETDDRQDSRGGGDQP